MYEKTGANFKISARARKTIGSEGAFSLKTGKSRKDNRCHALYVPGAKHFGLEEALLLLSLLIESGHES